MIGGAVGAGARHLTGRATLSLLGPGYPFGTLAVNLIGGFAMGLLVGALARMSVPGENWRLLLGVGVLGGYTTFSAFSLDFSVLMQRGDHLATAFYLLGSVGFSILGLYAGLWLTRIVLT